MICANAREQLLRLQEVKSIKMVKKYRDSSGRARVVGTSSSVVCVAVVLDRVQLSHSTVCNLPYHGIFPLRLEVVT